MEQAFIEQIIKNYDHLRSVNTLDVFAKMKWINCPPSLSKKDRYMTGYFSLQSF